jgi:hypothetical protein
MTTHDRAQDLLGEVWPSIDPTRLTLAAQRYDAVVLRLLDVQTALAAAAEATTDGLAGRTREALAGRTGALSDRVAAAVDVAQGNADFVRGYADAITRTQERLTVAAAIADRDLTAASVLTVTSGEVTSMIGAEHAAATVLAAVAGELDDRTRELANDAVAQANYESTQQSGSAVTPMVPGAMMGAMAPALAAAGATMHGGDVRFSGDVASADLAMLRARAAQLSAVQPPEVAPWIRLAVGLGEDHDGRRIVVVGTSEPAGYLRPGTVPERHEVVVGDGRPPELAIVDYLRERELVPIAVCATTPPTTDVQSQLAEAGVATASGVDDNEGQESSQ